jgi:hypothetical protein
VARGVRPAVLFRGEVGSTSSPGSSANDSCEINRSRGPHPFGAGRVRLVPYARGRVSSASLDQRFADLIKWSFAFWIGAVAAAALARGRP